MAQSQGYAVKAIEPVAVGSDVQARLFTLAPGETIPWHFHSAVTDWYFVLEGALSIENPGPRRPPRAPHRPDLPHNSENRPFDLQPLRSRYPLPVGTGC